MKPFAIAILLLVAQALMPARLTVRGQDANKPTRQAVMSSPSSPKQTRSGARATARTKTRVSRPIIPPVTVLNNPEYISGEASISVAANSNPLIRIGIAQNGVTLIEFPAADRFFAIHAGNSDLVTVEKSPSLKRDHHLILRAGSGFLSPELRVNKLASTPATSLIAQMDSGMAITVMVYPVPLLKHQAHRLVIKYDRNEVVSARQAVGLATNLVGPEPQPELTSPIKNADPVVQVETPTPQVPKADYKSSVDAALDEVISNPNSFKRWAEQRHGLTISATPPRELTDSVRLVVFAVRNTSEESVRIVPGYPDLYVETLNEKRRPVEAGTKIETLYKTSSTNDNAIAPKATKYFALAYEAPILGAHQRLKIVVAHMSAADEPAMADVAAFAR